MRALYTLLIYPLQLLFEVVFTIASRIVPHPGYAIIVLSLIVNFLLLPLYSRADKLEKEQKAKKEFMGPWIKRINETFKRDERIMMLQAYYKINEYRSLDVFKESVSLMLQIPFFIAAYRFLSHLELLQGVSFGPIQDLGAPDHMLLGINVLPILMTLINVVSGIVYSKGMPLKSKIQLYGVAAVFLVLLYNSPSGLVFYWTLNNLFSCAKNVFYKLKKPGLVLSVLFALVGAFAAIYLNTVYYTPYTSRRIRLTVIALALILPLVFTVLKSKNVFSKVKGIKLPKYSKFDRNLFVASGLFMSILTGFLIPSAVVKISPSEFMDLMHLKNPLIYIGYAFLLAAGYFMVWGGVFFSLVNEKAKIIMSRVWLVMCPASLISYIFFGNDLGDISVNFVYFRPFEFSLNQKMLNLLLVCAVAVIILILAHFKTKLCGQLIMLIAVVSFVMSVINMIPINNAYRENLKRVQTDYPHITLSADGLNVMVIMLDRAPGYLVPIVFDELPYLYEQFDGFTYYPNTLSFGNRTKFAAPALFGGYEYTPAAINANTTQTLVEKHDEALSVMPIMFRDEGWEVTIMDPPFAGYSTPSDLTGFTGPEYEGINTYYAEGVVMDNYYKFEDFQEKIWLRNFFCYSVFKVSPLFFQATIYNEGRYNEPESPVNYETDITIPQVGFSESSSGGVDRTGMAAFQELSKLDEITSISSDISGSFMYMDNDVTHDAMLFQAPEYIPYQYVDNIMYDIEHADRFANPINGYYLDMDNYTTMRHYSGNAAAYVQLGLYFDYLREQGVWDNTRIIIVADHAIARGDANMFGGQLDLNGVCLDSFNPVLMVKDFGSTGFTINEDLMTNADVPYLATNGVIDNPVNPFTGNPITMDGVHDLPLYCLDSNDWMLAGPTALRFTEDDWYAFDGTTVIDRDAWGFDGTR